MRAWHSMMRQIQPWACSLRVQFENLLRVPAPLSLQAPHVRGTGSVQAFWNTFVIASIPAWLTGLWNVGYQANLAIAQLQLRELPGWRAAILENAGIGFEASNIFACFIHGFLWFLPVFVTALLAGAICQALFSQIRRRPPDDGLLYIAWFFTLLMPATVPLLQVVLGMAFGVIMGKLVFGGSGRYLFNPALLGAAFLVISYPGLIFGPGAWVPVIGYEQPTVLELVIDEGGFAVFAALDYRWLQLFLGNQPGGFGTSSVLAILLGAAWLVFAGVASWRVILGSFAGLACTVFLFNFLGAENPLFAIPWYWHAVLGGFAFATVFIATDPVAGALTSPGRWTFGAMVGFFTVIIRLANPSYYEGVMFAILLASTFTPLVDHAVVALHARRRAAREQGSA